MNPRYSMTAVLALAALAAFGLAPHLKGERASDPNTAECRQILDDNGPMPLVIPSADTLRVNTIYYYLDNDGDGYGSFRSPAYGDILVQEAGGFGYVANADDCDDADPAVNPREVERCFDGIDNDCDGSVDFIDSDCANIYDGDGDGYTSKLDCDDANPNVSPGSVECCNDGLDNDCDGATDLNDSDCCGYQFTVTRCDSPFAWQFYDDCWALAAFYGLDDTYHSRFTAMCLDRQLLTPPMSLLIEPGDIYLFPDPCGLESVVCPAELDKTFANP